MAGGDRPAADWAFAEALKRIRWARQTGAQGLHLSVLGLTEVPPDIGNLSSLTWLDLNGNQLTSLPAELCKLTRLTELRLHGNQLSSLPAELGNLSSLTTLYLNGNQLFSLPAELGNLSSLTSLWLQTNQLTSLPPELGNLSSLTTLYLYNNQLTSLPAELGNLSSLTSLFLGGNKVAPLPAWFWNLRKLKSLSLTRTGLTEVPRDIGNLTRLTELWLNGNQLTSLPPELGKLSNLTTLWLDRNQLTSLPPELGKLEKLGTLDLNNNPKLTSPPPEIVAQGTEAVLRFLRERLKKGRRQWVSKLILVGEGGVGKSELLRSLRGEKFSGNLETTHGIEVRRLELAHPSQKKVKMLLNCWDFGGQEIYHATHQFFLTQRSLFVLVWSARQGWEANRLYYWLDAIKARAPDAPVIIVATWTDERSADLPLAEIQHAYPQVKAHFGVSNKKREGIEDLRAALARVAAELPLMGEEWPDSWLSAAEEIRASREKHVTPQDFCAVLSSRGVAADDQKTLGRMLHDLGDVLWFQDDRELNDLVILKPQWVTEYISKVLESRDVISKDGIFTQAHMAQLWHDLRPEMRDHFLRLMERFDLSYRTLDPQNKEISLVVERLSLDPAKYEEEWKKPLEQECCRTITMRYRVKTAVPAGIPTWFIARSHRFTTHTHWRNGALFADGKEKRHLALVRAYPHERMVELSARGPMPHNFFALLRDGFELTLARFPGLDVTRTMPCPGHGEGRDRTACGHEFKYASLAKFIESEPPTEQAQCAETGLLVPVSKLVFGIHWRTEDDVRDRMKELHQKADRLLGGQDEFSRKLDELIALEQRRFISLFNALQKDPDVACPSIFTLRPKDRPDWVKGLVGQKVELHLWCQYPGRWHPCEQGGCYEIPDPPAWARAVAPYLRKLVNVLKTTAPVGAAVALHAPAALGEAALTAVLIDMLPGLAEGPEARLRDALERPDEPGSDRAVLHWLRAFLDKADPGHMWGGLRLVLTPEGHYLWLCEEHAREFAPGPLAPK